MELLVKLNAWQYWKERSLHVNIRHEVIYSGRLSSGVPNACDTTLLNDGRNVTEMTAPNKNLR